MKICRVWMENIPGSPYSQSTPHEEPKKDRESAEDYDVRTWRNKCTTDANGQVCAPAQALKQCIDTAAQKLGMKVPRRRGATYKPFFASGVICNADMPLANGRALTPAAAEQVTIYAHANGRRGSGSRVRRRFPSFPVWHGVAEFTIVDDIITREVFEHTVKTSGMIVGIGRFRVENAGTNGRFRVTKFEWEDMSV